MTHDAALGQAIDLTKIALSVSPIDLNKSHADHLAEFIETLTQRIEKM